MDAWVVFVLISALGTSIAVSSVHYEVETCIVADLSMTVTLNSSASFIELENVNGSSGKCKYNETYSNLLVNLDKGGSVIFTFQRRSDGVYLEQLVIRYRSTEAYSQLNYKMSENDTYFECYIPQTFSDFHSSDTMTVNVNIEYIKVQAFSVENNTYSGNGSVCVSHSTQPQYSTTIHPEPNTTVHHETTTHANGTTEVPPQTTTHANGTTEVPPQTTVNPNGTTTVYPVTTFSPPQSKNVTLAFEENGVFCVVVTFNGTIEVHPPNMKNPEVYHIAQRGTVNGSCGESEQVVETTLPNGWSVQFSFEKSSSKVGRRLLADNYHMSEVSVTYIKEGSSTAQTETIEYKDEYQVNVGQSYLCKSKNSFKGKNVTLSVVDFQAQAFRTSNSTTFSSGVECAADTPSKPNNTVPIVVGVCLAVLVIVIVIAYLIGRRRQRQNNYESMN